MPTVHKVGVWVPISDQAIVDFGVGSKADILDAAVRLELAREVSDRHWRSLPLHVRAARTLRYQRWRAEERIRTWLHSWLFPDHEDGA